MAPITSSFHEAVRSVMVAAAERAILPRFRRLGAADIHRKAAEEIVTTADRDSEAILAAGLAAILPEAAIVGEEAADIDPAILERLGDESCWIIDPLDGTANYAEGKAPFGILVALAERGVPIGGWIYDPLDGRFCCASRGQGLLIDGAPVRARATGESVPVAAISSLFMDSERRDAIYGRLGSEFSIVSMPRCAAEQYPRVALGVNDLALFERTLPWDHAAGVLCLIEAGGGATRFDGAPYRVDDARRGLIAASTPALREKACDLLRDIA